MDIPLILLLICLIGYIFKSLFDLINNHNLTKREKTNISYVIVTIPIIGSMWYYFYASNKRKTYRS